MEQANLQSVRQTMVRLCIDETSDYEIQGHVENPLLGSVPFDGVLRMFSVMETFYNQINYPQNMFQMRSFVDAQAHRRGRPRTKSPDPGQPYSTQKKVLRPLEGYTETDGTKATFEVFVVFRHYASWQGSVYWIEAGRTQKFRSTLELLALVEEAVQTRDPAGASVNWEDAVQGKA